MSTYSEIFKALSDETRLRILLLLADQQLCVCQLSGVLQLNQPKVSKNLAKLRDLGLVLDERREKFVYYSLNPQEPLLAALLETLISNVDAEDNPVLTEDRRRLGDKDTYLNICTNIL